MITTFQGYERLDGLVGVRNHIVVMAVADCAEPVARMIADGVEGAVAISQHHGCIASGMVANTLIGVGKNPNVAAVLLVGMGCEGMSVDSLGNAIKESRKPTDWISIQKLGGTCNAVTKGKGIVKAMLKDVRGLKRERFGVSRLVVGVKCGGSDTTSGLAGNPAVGAAVDMLVDAGGAVLMSEPEEAIGAEDPLAKRAISEEVRERIYRMIGDEEKRCSIPGVQTELMCKGNVEGGLTTIEEKSLGAIYKSGSRPIKGVLENSNNLLERVPEKGGFYLQDGTHLEPMTMSSMAAAGAQLIVFITGRGGTFGHAIVPMIKVTGNSDTYFRMKDDMDINASTIIEGQESVEAVGQRIFNEIIEVASGKLTRGEVLGYDNFSVFQRDPRLDVLLGIGQS
jgi:altronate dehydratase large subunit